MKKLLSLSLAMLLIVAAFAMPTSAAGTSAFDKETFRVTDKTTIMWDNNGYNSNKGQGGNAFCYAGNYGTGRNGYGDTAGYKDVDFGSKGAKQVIVNFGYHLQDPATDEPTTFAIYVDNIFGNPVAEFSVKAGTTKGSEIVNHQEFKADVQVSAGKHNVYFIATNDKSGSYDWIQFVEADKEIKTTKTVASTMKDLPSYNAFEGCVLTNNGSLILDYIWSGSNPIKWVDNHGCGYSYQDDMIVYSNVDFGSKGAKKVTISYANGGDAAATLGIFIDDPLGEPAATISAGSTGGWTLDKAKDFTADIEVPNGKHTVIVKWLTTVSGSFTTVKFTESDTVIKSAEQIAAEAEAAANASASTGDETIGFAILAVVSAAAIVVASKKRAH
ncbi:MAG: carbohydrate-binding protein [Clostridia bacterium]|nr:carbohydrate-binding protein [Clostridia bacterium]